MKPNWWAVWEGCKSPSHVFLRVTRDHVIVINKHDPALCLRASGRRGDVVFPRLAMSLFENGQHTLPSGIQADVSLTDSWVTVTRSNLSSLMGSATGMAEAETRR